MYTLYLFRDGSWQPWIIHHDPAWLADVRDNCTCPAEIMGW